MNRRAMSPVRALSFAATLSLMPLVAGCGPAAEPPLAGSDIGGPFELTDSTGKTVRWNDFAGKYRIVYFGFTYCPDVCPTDLARMSGGLEQFERDHPELGARVQPIFVSVDPDRDTPAVVAEFIANFHPRLAGLTGTPEQVEQAAAAFKVFYEKGEPAADGKYLVNHSTVTYLFGPEGEPLATLPTDLGPEAVAAELATWVS